MKFIDGDLPEPTPRTRWKAVAAELASRPGVWAAVVDGENHHEGQINSGRQRLPFYGCEVTVRRNAEGGVTLYARKPAQVA